MCPPAPSFPRPIGWVGPRSRASPLPHPGGLLTGGRRGPLCPRSATAPPPWTAGAPGEPSQEGVGKLCSRARCGLTNETATGRHSLRASSCHVCLGRGRTPPPPPPSPSGLLACVGLSLRGSYLQCSHRGMRCWLFEGETVSRHCERVKLKL